MFVKIEGRNTYQDIQAYGFKKKWLFRPFSCLTFSRDGSLALIFLCKHLTSNDHEAVIVNLNLDWVGCAEKVAIEHGFQYRFCNVYSKYNSKALFCICQWHTHHAFRILSTNRNNGIYNVRCPPTQDDSEKWNYTTSSCKKPRKQ